jgi:hypothetical protein
MWPANRDTFSSANRTCGSMLGTSAGHARCVGLVMVQICRGDFTADVHSSAEPTTPGLEKPRRLRLLPQKGLAGYDLSRELIRFAGGKIVGYHSSMSKPTRLSPTRQAAERRWDVARGASPWKRSRRRFASPRRGRQVPDNKHSNHAKRPHRRDVPFAPFGGFCTSRFRIPGADAPGYTLSSLRDFDHPEFRR